jgi:hypothetical protein
MIPSDPPEEEAAMNAPLVAAGSLAVVAAAIHGTGGEILVVRKLARDTLPTSPFGGTRMTLAMIHVTWHITTVAFLTVGVALLLAGAALEGDAARGLGVLGAGAFTGFAMVALGLGLANTRSVRALFHHLGPAVIALTAALGWWGVLSL